MTVVNGDVTDVCGVRGDGVLRVAATRSRPGFGRAGLVVDSWHTVPISQGKFTTPDLDPGPARFLVSVGTTHEEFRVDVPAEGPVSFQELLDVSFQYDPPVVGRAQAAASEAAEHARRAQDGAQRVGSAEAILEATEVVEAAAASTAADVDTTRGYRDEAVAARDETAGYRDEAKAAAASAVENAEAGVRETVSDIAVEALQLSTQMKQARDQTEGYHDEALAARDEARDAAGQAQAHATEALGYRDEAQAAKAAGDQLLVEGRSLAETGRADSRRAEEAKAVAEAKAREAGQKATAADQSAQAAALSAEAAKQGAPDGGWTKSQLHVNVQAQLDKVDSLPTSQTVQSLIAGKADEAALREGLAGKLDDMPVSENATQSTLVKRTSAGRIKAAAGQASDDLVTRAQLDGVDTALAGKAGKSHTHQTSQIEGLDAALASKASKSHTHDVGSIDGLAGRLAEVRAVAESRAVVKQVTDPPSNYEPGVLYVIPE